MDGNPAVGLMALAGALIGLAVLMLVGRELVTWYWKVNEALERLAVLEKVLRNIDKNLVTLTDMAQEREPQAQREAS